MNKVRKPTQALVGRRIKLTSAASSQSIISPGEIGTVTSVDVDTGDVYVSWETRPNDGPVAVNWERGDRWSIAT